MSHRICRDTLTGIPNGDLQPQGPLPGAFDNPTTQSYFAINPRRQRPSKLTQPPAPVAPEPKTIAAPPVEAAPPPVAPPKKLSPDHNLAAALVKILRPDLFVSGAGEHKRSLAMDAIFDMLKPLGDVEGRKSSVLWSAFFDVPAAFTDREQKRRLAVFWRKLGLYDVFMTLYSDNPELGPTSPMSIVEIYRSLRFCCSEVEPYEHYAGLTQGVKHFKKFRDPNSKGPVVLLTIAKLEKLPPGTVIWNLDGEFQIIGTKVDFGREDYLWGVRPIAHEFDTTFSF